MPLRLELEPAHAEQIGTADLDIICKAYETLLEMGELSFVVDIELVSKERIQEINAEFREIDEPTDVLSFPTVGDKSEMLAAAASGELLLGSIVICPEKVEAYEETLPQMVHHGLLHLFGYDHEADMAEWKAEEGRILEGLKAHGLVIPPVPDDAV